MASICLATAALTLFLARCLAGIGPVIDLGYNLQQAASITTLENTYDIYQFYDIRYAASTTGANRFKAPQAPSQNRTTIQRGGQHWACPQANQSWNVILEPFLQQYNFGRGKTVFERSDFPPALPPNTTIGARTTEDCLFLDLYVPKNVLDGMNSGRPGVPVLVQIVGGGYASGTKDLDPTGLFLRDREQRGDGLIVSLYLAVQWSKLTTHGQIVSINYRLGAFGFLAGNNFVRDGGVANAGLLDQRFALQWVQRHICKFGGDPKNVTVIGESAGGGSIMYQITAYGGARGSAPFQKALLQSPGVEPQKNDAQRNTDYANFLKLLGVSNLAQARELPFATVYAANVRQIYDAPYGHFVYGPVVVGTFAPDLPAKLLAKGKFHRGLDIMVGHNADEVRGCSYELMLSETVLTYKSKGISFTSPFIQNTASFKQDVASWLPARVATQNFLDFVADHMYPEVFDGSQGYTDQIGRTAKALTQVKVFNTTGNLRMQRDDVANERCNIWQRVI
ncbi:hypothetical protein PRZ48_008351 [Zasmidium cellare]|uniref:Carboxylic ester hydrolase n=1 Tax=Zasmidium cellare TaxID=395010 RepID=A0ABR0EF97_ZASCE|nr:hypothetical protein PRZ48_008351 [Zasmidium cellare]